MEKYYSISRSQLVSLLAAYHRMRALDEYGIDNWSGYGENFDEYLAVQLKLSPRQYDSAGGYDFEDLAEYIIDVDREFMPI